MYFFLKKLSLGIFSVTALGLFILTSTSCGKKEDQTTSSENASSNTQKVVPLPPPKPSEPFQQPQAAPPQPNGNINSQRLQDEKKIVEYFKLQQLYGWTSVPVVYNFENIGLTKSDQVLFCKYAKKLRGCADKVYASAAFCTTSAIGDLEEIYDQMKASNHAYATNKTTDSKKLQKAIKAGLKECGTFGFSCHKEVVRIGSVALNIHGNCPEYFSF